MKKEIIITGADQPQHEITYESKILELASRPDFDPDKLSKLIDMQEKMEAKQAEKALNQALSSFQRDCPIINKTKKGHNSNYAPFDEIIHTIKPILGKYGLSYYFDTKPIDASTNLITVTIRHSMGAEYASDYYFEKVDDGGKMNSSQRRKSALTYAKRAAIESALGIAVQEEDDDANRATDTVVSEDQKTEILSIAESTNTSMPKLLKFLKVEDLSMLTALEAKKAIKALKQKRTLVQGRDNV